MGVDDGSGGWDRGDYVGYVVVLFGSGRLRELRPAVYVWEIWTLRTSASLFFLSHLHQPFNNFKSNQSTSHKPFVHVASHTYNMDSTTRASTDSQKRASQDSGTRRPVRSYLEPSPHSTNKLANITITTDSPTPPASAKSQI